MPTIAELTIKVNSTDARRAATDLDTLSASASKAENTSRKSNKGAEDSFRRLAESIDPVRKRLRELEEQETALRNARARGDKGAVASYDSLNSIIQGNIKRLNDLGAQTGKTAKEINFAMRGLPAQFTDIFVSLQGGQAPLTVFLQQGGQIKDMFGGIGPAFRAMGGYILSLINPLSVAAAALGALGVGFVLGQKEASNFNKALITTGNIAGVTSDSLAESARAIAANGGTQRAAAAALTEVAQAGRFTAEQIDSIAEAAVRMNSATGKAVSDTVGEFEQLAKEPTRAIAELNSKYNFLTASVFEQIQALEEQGRTQEAARLAIDTYSSTLDTRTKDIKKNLGIIETGWKAISGAAKLAIDTIAGVGREDTFSDQLEAAEEAVRVAERARDATYRGRQGLLPERNKEVELARQYVEELKDQQEGERLVAQQQGIRQEIQNRAIAAEQKLNSQYESSLSNVDKIRKQLADTAEEYRKIQAAGNVSADTEKKYQATLDATNKKLEQAIKSEEKRNKPAKSPKVTEDAGARLLSTLQQQEASLEEQLQSNTKLGTQAQAYARLQQQFTNIELKAKTEKLTKEQQSLLANKQELLNQQQKNVGIEEELRVKQELVKLDATRAAIEQQVANDRQKYQDALIGATSSDKEAERMRERNRLEQEYQRELQQLAQQRNAGDISQENYDASVQEYRAGLEERKALLQQYYSDIDGLQSDWSVGAKKAFENYLEEGRNVAGLTQSFFTSAFKSMEDSIVGFVTTGKLSFKDLTVSILSDLARMATRIAINQALTAVLGAFSGGFGGAAAGAATSATTSTGSAFAGYAAKGKAFSGGVEYFANGGTFSNSIVNTPTAFGTGRGLGVMGEAGPEAIVPLTRTSDGQLGVKSIGGGSAVVAPVSVSIQMTGNEGGANSTSTNTEGNGRNVQYAIKGVVEQAISMALKPGGSIWSAMNGR